MKIIRVARRQVKHVLKNTLWALYGLSVRNPPIPSNPRRLVFVCLGNICRSAYAHHYCNKLLTEDSNLNSIEVASAGLRAKASSSPEIAIVSAEEIGVDLTGHRPVQIIRETMEKADMVFVMEPRQAKTLNREYPEYSLKVFLLPLFHIEPQCGSWYRYHIQDPYGRSQADFIACFKRIERCVRGLLSTFSTKSER